MTEMLKPGTEIQYRKVGIARLVKRYENQTQREDGSGWWEVEWVKAPKSYREKKGQQLYWFTAN